MSTREIFFNDILIAVVVTEMPDSPGVYFMTPHSALQQIGFQHRKAGEHVPLHAHERGPVVVNNFAEVIIVKRGKMKVALFSQAGDFIEEVFIASGGMILLESGAHEITFIEETEIYEVKQGPYIGRAEKRFFSPATK